MHRTVASVTVGLTVMASWVACRKPSSDPGPSRRNGNAVALAADPPNTGTKGHNGLSPDDFLVNLRNLEVAMTARLTTPPGDLNPSFAPLIPAYQTLADDAISCTVDQSTVVSYAMKPYSSYSSGTYDSLYPTSPLLQTTAAWSTAALKQSLQEDVYTCLATRLNPSVTPVEIWLGGHHVTENHAAPFAIDEALWATTINKGGSSQSDPPRITIDVWPSPALIDSCPKFADDVKTRVCGKTGCGLTVLTVHDDRSACVQGADGLYTCSSAATSPDVIWTRLACDSWCVLYPGCSVPKGCEKAGASCQPSGPR